MLTGIISTIVGTGGGATGFSGDGGAATSALMNYPYGVATDSTGILLFHSYKSMFRIILFYH